MNFEDLLKKFDEGRARDAYEDLRALHGIDTAKEVWKAMAADAENRKQLGDAFADAVMMRLKSESTVRSIFKELKIPEEWGPQIRFLVGVLTSYVDFFTWLDEVQMGNLSFHSTREAPDDSPDKDHVVIFLEPCSPEHFARMKIKERCPFEVDAFLGDAGAILRVGCATLPRKLLWWIDRWGKEYAYANRYKLQGLGLHTNHRPPYEFNLPIEATDLYRSAMKESKKEEAEKELLAWIETKMKTTSFATPTETP